MKAIQEFQKLKRGAIRTAW